MAETDFLQADDERDFALVIEGTKVYVDRSHLAKWSPVFKNIFYRQGAPFTQPENGMEMKDKVLEEFLIFLNAIFPTDKTMRINESNVATLLAYADEYEVIVLWKRCVEFMGDQLKGDTLINCLRLASLYGLKDLQKQLVPLVALQSIHQITAAHEVLPVAVLAAVYQAMAMGLAGKIDINSPTMPWGAFYCADCRSATYMSYGVSACCKKGVGILTTAAAQIAGKWSLTCSKCKTACSLNEGGYRQSLCCGWGVFVHPMIDSEDAADFSDELLDSGEQ